MTTADKNSAPFQSLRIGEILVAADIVGERQLPRVLQMARSRSLRVGQVLIMLRYISDDELEPILEIQKLINEGQIDSEVAIQALRLMRRDGLPLARAVEKVRLDTPGRAESEAEAKSLLFQIQQIESGSTSISRDLVPLLLKLGDTRVQLRETADAEKAYKRALTILEHSHGNQHAKSLPAMLKLLDLYIWQQRYPEAESFCWRIIGIQQTTYGAEHLETARSFLKLARILDAEGRFSEAEQYLRSSIRLMEKHLGIEHPEMHAVLRHFSSFWKRNSKQSEHKRIGELLVDAELLTNEQLSAALLQAHQQELPVGQSLVQLGLITAAVLRAGLQLQLLVQDGVIPAPVASRALRVLSLKEIDLEEALDEIGWHPDPISTKDLQTLMETSDELLAAERALGPNHPGVAVIAVKLGEQYTYARKFAYAENAYKRALTLLKQCWGQHSIELADCLFKLANLYYIQKRYQESESLHWKVLEIRKHALGDEHSDVAVSLERLAYLAEAQGNDGSAAHMRQAAKLIRSKGTDERLQTLNFLRERTIFRELDESTLDRVSGLCERLDGGPGEMLVNENASDGLYVVQSGRIDVLIGGSVIACVQTGECFAYFDDDHDDQDHPGLRAIEKTTLVKVGAEIVRDLRLKFAGFDAAVAEVSAKSQSYFRSAPASVVRAAASYGSYSSSANIISDYTRPAGANATTGSAPVPSPPPLPQSGFGSSPVPQDSSDRQSQPLTPDNAPVAGLQGNLAFFDLGTVLQTISNSGKEGYLRLSNHKKEMVAKLALRQGKLVFAEYRHLRGIYAVYDLICRNDPLDFVFEQIPVEGSDDRALSSQPLTMLIIEAARRSDELPALLESVGWPRTSFMQAARVLDVACFAPDVGSVAADIWLLLESGAENEKILDGVYSDRYTFLIALRQMLKAGAIRPDDQEATGSMRRLLDIRSLE